MKTKFDNLVELNEMFTSGKISEIEFEQLKKEILATDKSDLSGSQSKKRIILKNFEDDQGNLIFAPNIEVLNIENITDAEIDLLKPFISLKYKFAPVELTKDEIEIRNKILTISEISEVNSTRSGFNYPFQAILGLLSGAGALVFLFLSPCFLLIGAGWGVIAGIGCAIIIWNKIDATKADKITSLIGCILAVLAIICYINYEKLNNLRAKVLASSTTDNDLINSNSIDCSSKVSLYNNGYAAGQLTMTLGGTTDCSSFIEETNFSMGQNVYQTSECFCEGFNNAIKGINSKYKTETNVDNNKTVINSTKNTLENSYNIAENNNETTTLENNIDNTSNKNSNNEIIYNDETLGRSGETFEQPDIRPELINNIYFYMPSINIDIANLKENEIGINCVIEKNGSLSNVSISNKNPLLFKIENELLNYFSNNQNTQNLITPALLNNKAVRYSYEIQVPISNCANINYLVVADTAYVYAGRIGNNILKFGKEKMYFLKGEKVFKYGHPSNILEGHDGRIVASNNNPKLPVDKYQENLNKKILKEGWLNLSCLKLIE